jgi:hypothetical protein
MFFCLEISSVLEIRFSEPHWYKGKCKSALVRPFSLCALPDISLFSSKQELSYWLQYCTAKDF